VWIFPVKGKLQLKYIKIKMNLPEARPCVHTIVRQNLHRTDRLEFGWAASDNERRRC
jgi:hypothetical protein